DDPDRIPSQRHAVIALRELGRCSARMRRVERQRLGVAVGGDGLLPVCFYGRMRAERRCLTDVAQRAQIDFAIGGIFYQARPLMRPSEWQADALALHELERFTGREAPLED